MIVLYQSSHARAYDLIETLYFKEEGRSPRQAILACIPDRRADVLDLCCGTMASSIAVAKNRRQVRLVGLDSSPAMLEAARKKLAENGVRQVTLTAGNAAQMPFAGESFDYIILGLVLHEAEAALAERILQETKRVLRPEGRLLVLEWERPSSLWRRIRLLPVTLFEPKPFKAFYKMDKPSYFAGHGFQMVREIHCDYSCVYEMKK